MAVLLSATKPVRAPLILNLSVFHTLIEVHCVQPRAAEIISTVFAHFLCQTHHRPTLQYRITTTQEHDGSFSLYREQQLIVSTTVESDLLYYFEKDLTITLQHYQPHYFYMHAAVLEKQQQLIVLSGESGAGKSTTSWALLHHGFRYLSDELAPIDPGSLSVLPYPHAICLKQTPPAPYTLPPTTLWLEKTCHVPITPEQISDTDENHLCYFIFIKYQAGIQHATLQRLLLTEATLNIYKNALNQLAHANDGLQTALFLAEKVPAYQLTFCRIEDALHQIQQVLMHD